MDDDSNSEFSLNKTDDEVSLRDSLLNELTDATAFDMNSQNAVNNDNELSAEEIAGGNNHPLQHVDLADCNKEEDGISGTEGAARRNTNDLDGNVYGNIDGNCYEEVLAVIGMVIAMGMVRLPSVDDYWSSTGIFDMLWFYAILSRFSEISRYLHCANNENTPSREHDII